MWTSKKGAAPGSCLLEGVLIDRCVGREVASWECEGVAVQLRKEGGSEASKRLRCIAVQCSAVQSVECCAVLCCAVLSVFFEGGS